MLNELLEKYKDENLNNNIVFRVYENDDIRTAYQAISKYDGKMKLLYSLISLPEEPLSLDNVVILNTSSSNDYSSSKSLSGLISSPNRKSISLNLSASNPNTEKQENDEIERNEINNVRILYYLKVYYEIVINNLFLISYFI